MVNHSLRTNYAVVKLTLYCKTTNAYALPKKPRDSWLQFKTDLEFPYAYIVHVFEKKSIVKGKLSKTVIVCKNILSNNFRTRNQGPAV